MPFYDDYDFNFDYDDFQRDVQYAHGEQSIEDLMDSDEEFDAMLAKNGQDNYERQMEDRFNAMHDGDYVEDQYLDSMMEDRMMGGGWDF